MANVAVSKANHVWVFCWAWPRFSCCFAALTTKRMSGRGICGSSCCAMMSLFLLDLPFYWYWPIAHCTIFLTAYVSFRTVPQSIYGQSRGKKKLVLANCALYHFSHHLCFFQDRATEHLRPISRKKKTMTVAASKLVHCILQN